ncbi:MAG: ACP S-malonyltransferase [Ruminococcus sp.]|nr:ACP S-malonyltransferase [Ruminococcus sp.]
MTISLFSGQGSQEPGMGKDILEAFGSLGFIFDTGSEILGKDLRKICFDTPIEELSLTINAQPAIMAMSILCHEASLLKGYSFDGVAGHSLGEYAGLYASGMVSLEDAFRLIKARAEAMHTATTQTKGAMVAVMKLEPEKIAQVCDEAKEYASAVNYNSPQQTVVAGTPEGIAEVSAVFAEMGARVIPLNVAGAFHSKLMKPASDIFLETAKTIQFNAPKVKYYSNVTGAELTDFSDMPALLAKHIVSPVKFTSELSAMSEAGADTFFEFGPGKTLTGLVKKTLKGVKTVNISSVSALEEAFA